MLLLLLAAAVVADPVILDNGHLRVEVDPQLFAIRFLGVPGGQNFIEPLFVDEKTALSGAWADPGGIVTDVLPLGERDAALRRGPAVAADQTKTHVLLIGPESPATGLRLKKEITLLPDRAAARLTISLLSSRPETQRLALRTMARVPAGATLRIPRHNVELASLSGAKALAPLVVKSMRFWLIPIPPTAPARDTLLGGNVDAIGVETRAGVWNRQSRVFEDAPVFPQGHQALLIIDDATKSYGTAFHSPEAEVSVTQPLVWTEEWEIDPRGGK